MKFPYCTTRPAALAVAVAVILASALPAVAGGYAEDPNAYAQQGGYYQQGGGFVSPTTGGGYYQQGSGYTGAYYPQGGPVWHPMPPVPAPGHGRDQGRLGRTLGGAAGLAAGAIGGLALGSVLIRASGIAALGPIAPLVVLGAVTAGGAWIGAKGLSLAGLMGDKTLGRSAEWTMVGAIAGAVLGFTLLPALGPFAGPLGRILGAALGGVAGGILANLLSPALNKIATPPVLFGTTGALVGGMGFGVPGALAGAAGGYALGSIMDKNFFVNPNTEPDQVAWDVRDEFTGFSERMERYGQTASDWVHNQLDRFSDRARYHWDEYDYPSDCYDDYTDSRRYAYDQLGYSPQGPGNSGVVAGDGAMPADLKAAQDAYYGALEQFQKISESGSESDRAGAYSQVQQTEAQYARLKALYGGH